MDIKEFNEKLDNLTIKNKLGIMFCLFFIFGSLYFMSTIDTIETVTYFNHGEIVCKETYINGDINGSYCKENTLIYPNDVWVMPDLNNYSFPYGEVW